MRPQPSTSRKPSNTDFPHPSLLPGKSINHKIHEPSTPSTSVCVYTYICASNITRSQLGELSTFVSHLRGPPVTLPHLTTLWIRRFFAGCLCPLSVGPKKSFLQLSSHDTTNVQNLDKTSPSSTPAGPFLSLNSANTILPSVNQPKENYYRIFTLFTLNVLRSPWFSLLFFSSTFFLFFTLAFLPYI